MKNIDTGTNMLISEIDAEIKRDCIGTALMWIKNSRKKFNIQFIWITK